MAESVRGGIISVDPGQMEGAKAIGMTHVQAMKNVILPQAIPEYHAPDRQQPDHQHQGYLRAVCDQYRRSVLCTQECVGSAVYLF